MSASSRLISATVAAAPRELFARKLSSSSCTSLCSVRTIRPSRPISQPDAPIVPPMHAFNICSLRPRSARNSRVRSEIQSRRTGWANNAAKATLVHAAAPKKRVYGNSRRSRAAYSCARLPNSSTRLRTAHVWCGHELSVASSVVRWALGVGLLSPLACQNYLVLGGARLCMTSMHFRQRGIGYHIR
jgi:hypothetical protein